MCYSAFDRELLAIISAVKHFLYLLEERPFTMLTDHKPLTNALDKHRPIDYAIIAASQTNDEEPHHLRMDNTSSLQLRQLPNAPALSSKVTRHVYAPLHRFPAPTTSFQSIPVDIVGPLPPSRGMRYLLTCIDRFVAPHAIITDRGAQFESGLWSRLLKFFDTNRNRTTAYHPQANSLVKDSTAS
ncbi:uncharacterized protein LOC143033557 [Oratosquilla oratoria]|uniref:uncharacterized protein LOC143033557 n=1 Tax=Oratosquilla oratoria TaxID=337810 RepID=UPI003F7582C5